MQPRVLFRLQGGYFVATGLWPIVHFPSFEAVTGPKVDDWLVRMVGLLAASIGATLLVAARRKSPSAEAFVLAVTSALSFAAIDVWYAARGRISPIYLADAVIEIALVVLVLLVCATKLGRIALMRVFGP